MNTTYSYGYSRAKDAHLIYNLKKQKWQLVVEYCVRRDIIFSDMAITSNDAIKFAKDYINTKGWIVGRTKQGETLLKAIL